MTPFLADGNVLVALTVVDHVHHDGRVVTLDKGLAALHGDRAHLLDGEAAGAKPHPR